MDFLIAITWMIFGFVWMKLCSRKSSTQTTRNQPAAVYPKLDLRPDVRYSRQRLTEDSITNISTGGKIPDQDLFFRLMGQLEENNTLKEENQRLASQVTRLQLEIETSKSKYDESFQIVHDELLAARCQLDAKNREMAQLESTTLELNNKRTALEKDAAVQADRIDELKDQYKKACAHAASMHRAVRGLHDARTLLQRDKAKLVEQLDSKSKEIEEERAIFDKKLEDSQMENEENLIRVRNFHQALNNKRNSKMNELEEMVSDLNLTIVECEEDHRTEMEATRASHSIALQERDENLAQLQSTVEELNNKNSELTVTLDEMEIASYALPNFYKILDVERNATEEDIKLAYQKEIRQVHPDKIHQMHSGSTDERILTKATRLSQTLNRAKDILNNQRLKYQYDCWLDMTELRKTEQKVRDYEAYEERKRHRN
ncbi:dnaJ homolog subfamily C member 7 homolog [Daphnia pulex]|uniref:dnaJ homolog subfamily C member 7 homolog n=1 Tax=Daphnia pulex TaxID=6669 RepID=UPI001EE0570C|nr:dnaJ homolog subfamily C member 7 homolog [Daphnia pulex]